MCLINVGTARVLLGSVGAGLPWCGIVSADAKHWDKLNEPSYMWQ